METTTIESRSDFAQWAIERARAIVADQAGDLAVAARAGNEEEIARTANALGQAITGALIEVFDGLIPDE
ncbi:hypothetical protein LL06_18815 [Hoeflea sp. BAL378]|uniref:hypothetical protein n=1 Tax=Hoeflea sp. BAL378 TaxID=1547437 RepID=UPI0005131E10|nr:hypothetical protein [Hoeflea sp. BAL378]KGF68040.1 hypothetical protein LL06_18815 [Hoeflea sp. BAL378]